MSFTHNWFEKLAKYNFDKYIKPEYDNKPCNYLEIGSYEGASALYMFENVLNHSDSRATVIDPFDDFNGCTKQLDRFRQNLNNHLDKINIMVGYSENELSKLPINSFDFIYIDGDHTTEAVYIDALLSFPLLKSGGIMIFDDYMWIYNGEHVIPPISDPRLLHPNNPHGGINRFLNLKNKQVEIIEQNWQLVLRKL